MANEKQKIVSDAGFIESIRDLGLTTTDAVNEIVDNSFDAEAENVWITLEKDSDDKIYMILEDDGQGIPKDDIKKVLTFGGRLPSGRITTGKFGWGLPSAAFCQSPSTELYSKVAGGNFFYNYIDLDELKKEEGYLPETTKKDPFRKHKNLCLDKQADSGTIVILKHLDRPERKTIDRLEELIVNNLARVQRKLLANGKSIYINGKKIVFQDPLMLMDGFDGIEECGKAEEYGDFDPIVYEDIIEDNGEPAKIDIKVAKLPVKCIRQKELQDKFNINVENQGFYIIRHGREIAGGQTLRLYSRHPQLNYFRAEISFPPSLDNKFGIQTNKSRFSLDDELRHKLVERLSKIIRQIANDIKADADELKAAEMSSNAIRPKSEEIADKARKKMKSSGYKPSQEELEQNEKEREKEKKQQRKRIEEDPTLTKNQRDEQIRKLNDAFHKDRVFERTIDIIGTGEFYTIKHKGKRIEVIINSAHGFFKKVYERSTQDPKMQILLDLFLFTLAQAEDQYFDNEDIRSFYNTQRREWSSIMSTFLEEAEKELND